MSSAIGKNFASQTKNFSVSSLRHLTLRQAKAVTWRINMNIGGIAPLKPYSLRRLTVIKAYRKTAARCLTDKFSHTASKSVAGSFRWHSRKEPATVLKMRISRTKRYNLFPLSPATHASGMGGDGCKRVWREWAQCRGLIVKAVMSNPTGSASRRRPWSRARNEIPEEPLSAVRVSLQTTPQNYSKDFRQDFIHRMHKPIYKKTGTLLTQNSSTDLWYIFIITT